MGAGVRSESPVELPAGYIATGLTDPPRDGAAPPVRLSIVARTKADDLGGHLILLRDTLDAQVFLGCIQDAADRVVPGGWVEIWVQNLEGFSRSSATSISEGAGAVWLAASIKR